MSKSKKFFRRLGLVCLVLLAMAGIGLPIPLYNKDRFFVKKVKTEQVDEKEEEGEMKSVELKG